MPPGAVDAVRRIANARVTLKVENFLLIARRPDSIALMEACRQEASGGDRPMGEVWAVVSRYERLAKQNLLAVIVARQGGKAVAFLAYMVTRSLHYASEWYEARHDSFFVLPAFRKGMLALQMVRFAEIELQKAGVGIVYHGDRAPISREMAFRRMGYEPVETVYCKRLDKEKSEAPGLEPGTRLAPTGGERGNAASS